MGIPRKIIRWLEKQRYKNISLNKCYPSQKLHWINSNDITASGLKSQSTIQVCKTICYLQMGWSKASYSTFHVSV